MVCSGCLSLARNLARLSGIQKAVGWTVEHPSRVISWRQAARPGIQRTIEPSGLETLCAGKEALDSRSTSSRHAVSPRYSACTSLLPAGANVPDWLPCRSSGATLLRLAPDAFARKLMLQASDHRRAVRQALYREWHGQALPTSPPPIQQTAPRYDEQTPTPGWRCSGGEYGEPSVRICTQHPDVAACLAAHTQSKGQVLFGQRACEWHTRCAPKGPIDQITHSRSQAREQVCGRPRSAPITGLQPSGSIAERLHAF